jgi:hypothetical protein
VLSITRRKDRADAGLSYDSMLVWSGICNAWNVFPPSKLMSFSLFCVHVGTLIGVWRGGYRVLHRASVDTKQS